MNKNSEIEYMNMKFIELLSKIPISRVFECKNMDCLEDIKEMNDIFQSVWLKDPSFNGTSSWKIAINHFNKKYKTLIECIKQYFLTFYSKIILIDLEPLPSGSSVILKIKLPIINLKN